MTTPPGVAPERTHLARLRTILAAAAVATILLRQAIVNDSVWEFLACGCVCCAAAVLAWAREGRRPSWLLPVALLVAAGALLVVISTLVERA